MSKRQTLARAVGGLPLPPRLAKPPAPRVAKPAPASPSRPATAKPRSPVSSKPASSAATHRPSVAGKLGRLIGTPRRPNAKD